MTEASDARKEAIHAALKEQRKAERTLDLTDFHILLEHLQSLAETAEASRAKAEKDMKAAVNFAAAITQPLLRDPEKGDREADREEAETSLQVLETLAPVVLDLEGKTEDDGVAITRRMVGQKPQPGYVPFMKLAVDVAASTTKRGHLAAVARALGQERQERFNESWLKKLRPKFAQFAEARRGTRKAA